jgi:hypothetical protein
MVDAPAAGKDRSDRIGIPIDKRLVTCWISIPHHFLHDVTVIDGNIIEGLWNISEGVDLNSVPSVPISEIGDIFEIPLSLDRLQKFEQRSLCGIPPDYKIDERILAEDLLMVIGGRESTQDDGDFRVKPLDDLRNSQCPLDMGHPVEIDAEGDGLIFFEEPLHIEFLILKHLHSHINDSDFETMTLQIF